jgi:addiction module HigA family antidote
MSSLWTIRTTTEQEVRIVVMNKPVHPGAVLREDVLADLGLGVGEAASRLGISRVALSRVLHEHARISPNLAVRLEEAGVGTARAWLAMQSAHDLVAERASGAPKVRRLTDVA